MTPFNIVEFIIGAIIFLSLMAYGVIVLILDRISSSQNVILLFCKETLRLLFTRRTYKRETYDDSAIERGDAYIDKLLEDMLRNRAEYDPYEIEDRVIGFNRKVLFVNVSGEAKLHDGFIKGLSTLHRPNHCSLSEDGERLLVKADLGAGQLDFTYAGSVKFMNFGPTITVHAILPYIEVHIEFTVDSKSGKEGKLEKLVIDDMRGMNVWITGLGPLNWAVNPIITGVTNIFKRFVRNFMENKVEKHIAERIPNFQFPVEEPVISEPKVTDPEQSKETNQEGHKATPKLESTSKAKLETKSLLDLQPISEEEPENTNKPVLKTSSTELEGKQPEVEGGSSAQLEKQPEVEGGSRGQLEKQPEVEGGSSAQLEKQPEVEGGSSAQLEKQPEVEGSSSAQLGKQPEPEGSSNEQLEKPELEQSPDQLQEQEPKTEMKVAKLEDKSLDVLKKSGIEMVKEGNESEVDVKQSDIISGGNENLSSSEGFSQLLSNEAAEALERLDASYQLEELPEDGDESFLEE